MRNDTLLGLSFVLSIVIVYTVRGILSYTGSSSSIVSLVSSPIVASFVFAPVLMIILVPFNKRILKWRKARGRDIEEEQKFETKGGFISLTRNDDGD